MPGDKKDASINGLNQEMLAQSPVWSPHDDAAGRSTSGHDPADAAVGGGVDFEVDLAPLPDQSLAVLHGLRLAVGDKWDNELNPGDYGELWVYKSDSALGFGDADWVDRVASEDFLVHFAFGYLGIEDTTTGTGGTSFVEDPPGGFWKPTNPVLSATGEFSIAWEGDEDEEAANKGEWALYAEYDIIEVSQDRQIQELLEER